MPKLPVAVITGASQGIGRGIAVKLAKNCYLTVLASRNEELLRETADEIAKDGGEYFIIPTDVSKPEEVERLFRQADKLGRLRLLINNAGVGAFAPVAELSLENWQKMLDVNLTGAFLCTQQAVRRMKKSADSSGVAGHIIFINSLSGKRPLPYSGGYSASKYGLKGLADTLRVEVRKFRIKVTSIFPGSVASSWWDKFDYDFPLEKMVRVDDVVAAVWSAVSQEGRSVVEEIDLRQVGGDF